MCKRYEADEGARKDQIRMHSATIAAPSVVKLPGLVRCRADAALSQRELAARAGISPVTVARLEGGQDARPRTIRKLAEALGVTPRDLMTDQRPSGAV